MNQFMFPLYFAFRDLFQRCKFSVTQGEIPWLFPGLEVINFGLSFPYLRHLYLKLSCWRQTTISFWNGFLMTIKTMKDRRHPLSVSLQVNSYLKSSLSRCSEHTFVSDVTLKSLFWSSFIVKVHICFNGNLKIETRQNYITSLFTHAD